MRAIRRIVIAPTAFKGSLDPIAAAEAMERGVRRVVQKLMPQQAELGRLFLDIKLSCMMRDTKGKYSA